MRKILFSLLLLVAMSLTITLKAQTCKEPVNLYISSLTTTSATLVWDLSAVGDVPSSYFFRLSNSSGTVIATDSNLVVSSQSHTMTNLTASTTYLVELGSTCNSTGSGISAVVSFYFTTPCSPQPAPYSEDFDSSVPSCTFSGNAVWSNGGRTGKCMALTTTASQPAYFVFPSLNLASDNVEAGIWMKASSILDGNVPFYVGIVTDPADIEGTFESIYTGQLTTTTWTEVRMNTSATTVPVTQSAMIAVVVPQGYSRTLYIDDASIHTIPTCIRPEDFVVTNVTATSATFAWTTTNASSVRIYLSSVDDTRSVTATTNPYTITTLVPNREYSFRIRALCSATDSSEINPTTLTARTECVTADSALFVQTFETLTIPNTLPDCWKEGWWTKPEENTRVFAFAATTDRAHNGSRSMAFLQQADGTVAYLSSQALPIDQSGAYTLSVWVYRQEASSTQSEGLRFWASPHPDDTTGATLLGFVPRHYHATPVEHTANEWYNYEFIINTAGTRYIIVEGVSQNGAPVLFDDLAVRHTPTCFRPSSVQFGTPTYNSLGLAWTPGNNEQQWIVSYSLNDAPYQTDTVAQPAHTIQNLASATAYSIEGTVTSLCGAADHSEPLSFNTYFVTSCQPLTFLPYSCGFESGELASTVNPLPLCWSRLNDATGADNTHPQVSTSTTYSHSGTGYLKFLPVTTTTDYGEHQVAILPPLNTTLYAVNTLRLVFYAQATTINPAPVVTIGVMSDPTDLATFTPTDSFTVGTTGYLRYEAHFGSYSGNGTYIAMLVRRVETPFLSLNVDDVRLEPMPSCADLDGTGVIVSDVTDNMATLTVSDLTATTWSYAYGVAGTPLQACTVVDTVAGTAVLLDNLTANTTYVVYARRRCGTDFGSWSGSVTFRTACGAVAPPYSDNFETYNVGQLGGCYNVVTDENYLNVFADAGGSGVTYNHTANGTKGLSSSYNSATSSTAPLAGDATMATYVHLEAGRNYEISIWAKMNTYTNGYRISILVGQSTSSLTTITTSDVNNVAWRQFAGYFAPAATGDYYIAFRTSPINNATDYVPFLDDISIHEVSCIPPIDAFVRRLGPTTATVGITSAGTAWDVAVSSTPISTSAVVGNILRDTVSVDTFAVGNLTPNTTYYYTIRTLCAGGETSEWMTPQSFHTRCTTANVPYTEGFESATSVGCWLPMGGEGTVTRETTIRHTGTSSLRATATSLVSPEFDVVSFAPYVLNGWVYSPTDSAVVTIGVMNDPDDVSSFEIISTVTVSPANTWVELTSYFNILNDPEYADFLNARHLVLATGVNTVLFDDFTINTAPTCNRPTQGVVTTITGNSVTVDWTENGTATTWRLTAVNPIGMEVTQDVTSHPFTLTGLTPATHYSLYVRSICTVTDTSMAYKIGDITTACAIVTAPFTETFEGFAVGTAPQCWDVTQSDHTTTYNNHPNYVWAVYSQGGNKSIRLYNAGLNSGDMSVITPEVILPAGSNCDLRFDYCHQASSGPLYVKIRRHGQTTFSTIATQTSNGTTDAATPSAFLTASVGLQAYAGDTVQFMFVNTTNWGTGSIWVDNFKVRILSDCSEIVSLTVQDVTANSVTLAFADTAAGHTTWQYAVVLHGHNVAEATPVDVTTKMFTINGLTPSTNYDIYVRAVCSGTDFSTWNSVTQKTLALPAALPYITDFSNSSQNNDWKRVGGGVNDFVFGNDANALFATGTHALYISNGNTYTYDVNTPSVSGIARLFSLTETNYSIEFDWKCPGGEGLSDFARFYLAPATSDLLPSYTGAFTYRNFVWPDNIIPLDGDDAVNLVEGGAQHLSQVVDMSGRAGDYYLVFVWVNDGSLGTVNYPLSVGNLSVSELTCEPVVNLTVADNTISYNTATATWDNPNIGSDIRWAVSTTALINDTIATGVTQNNTVTLAGLTPSTVYNLFVRAECTSLDRSPWVSVTFQTACAAITTFPHTESFEGTRFPPVCWTNTSLSSVTSSFGTEHCLWEQSTRYAHSGTKTATITTIQGTSALLATPAVHLDPTREYHVSFWLMQSSSTWNDDELDLYVGTDPSSTDGATLLAHYVIYNSSRTSSSLAFFDVDLPAGLAGEYYVLFKGTDVSNGFVYIDDVTIDIYPPCRNLTTLPTVVATTSTTVTLTMPVGARTAIRYGIAPYSASAQPSQIVYSQVTATGDVTFTGLTPNTMYSLFARGYCSDGDSTTWTTPVAATTKVDDCFAPENIHTDGNVSDTAATISWNIVPDVTSYECILTTASTLDTYYVAVPQVALTALAPNTDYTVTIRGFCGATDTTLSTSFAFRTLSTPATIPYVTGFEPTDDNALWQNHASGYSNNFIVGRDSEAHSSGTRGLFISSDGRSFSQSLPTNPTPRYGVNIYGVSYYTRTIYLPAAGNYEVSFDWKCDPVAGLSYEAYGRAFVAPATATLPVDDDEYLRNLPDGSFAIGSNLEKSSTWQRTSSIFTVNAPQYMNLVFMYISVNVNGYADPDHVSETPLAIDNVTVNEVTCLPVNAVTTLAVTDSSATVLVTQPEPVAIQYALMTTYSLDSLTITTVDNTTLRDTLHFAGLAAATDYYLVVRQRCTAADSSSWRLLTFHTNAVPAPLPYICDFEDDDENANWLYTQEQTNRFAIGASTSFGGTRSLYITDDGSSYHYDNTALSFGYAYRNIYLPAGLYEYSYDWQCNGEANDDGGRIFLLPADVLLFANSWLYGLSYTTVPKNAIALDNGLLYGTAAYNSHSGSFTVPADRLYNIVVAWRNGSSGGSNYPLSVDNITIRPVTCLPPTVSLVGGTLGENSATFAVANPNANSTLVCALSPTADVADALYYDTLPYRALDTIAITGLSASSSYYIHVRSLCSDDDRSFWTPLQFKTLCGVISLYPYTENFESLTPSNGYVANVASALCWSAINAVTAKPYYNITSTQHSEGSNSLRLVSSATVPLYMLLPEMTDLNNLYLTFAAKYDNASTVAGTLSVGYLADPADGSSFVSLLDVARSTAWTAQSLSFTSIPAGARMAFRYSGASSSSYFVYVDNIRVSQLVEGPVHNDTICNSSNYLLHGFNISKNQISEGDNTFTRIALGSADGMADTLIVAHVHRLPRIVTTSYDTICGGQPYTRGMWNILRPVTRSYTMTFRGASVNGCDSTVTLNLTVIPVSDVFLDTICHGGSYLFGDTTITDPGMYTRTYQNAYNCTCHDTLYLMVLADSVFDVATVCSNNLPYLWRGQSITTAGRHTLLVAGPRGCQQTAVLDLTVHTTDSTADITICQGGSAQFLDTLITTAGSHTIQRIDPAGGCMVTYHINATVTPLTPVDVYDYACQDYPYTGNGITGLIVTADTTVSVSSRTIDSRCDSLTNIHIRYIPTVRRDIYDTIANGETYRFNGSDLTKAGVYTANLRTVQTNCDSIVTLHLHVTGTAVDMVNDISIQIVPNPVNAGATALIYGDFGEVVKVEILSNSGQLIRSFVPESYPVEIDGISVSGLYYIRVTTASGSVHLRKLMVK